MELSVCLNIKLLLCRYIGLNYTYASSFQMLRGAIIVFTALLSVAFLRRSIKEKSWLGIACVVVGLTLVGVSDIVFSSPDSKHGPNEIITGNQCLILLIWFCDWWQRHSSVGRAHADRYSKGCWFNARIGHFSFCWEGHLTRISHWGLAGYPLWRPSSAKDVQTAEKICLVSW